MCPYPPIDSLKKKYPKRYKGICHCGVNLGIHVGHPHVFFGELSSQILSPFLNWVLGFFS